MADRSEASSVGGLIVALFVWAAVIALALYFFSSIVFITLMFLAAASVSAVLRPVANWVSHKRWLSGTILGVLFWLTVAVAILGLGWLLKGAIQEQIRRWPQIQQNLNDTLSSLSQRLGLEQPVTINQIGTQALDWLLGEQTGSVVATAANQLGAAVIALILLIFGSIYLLGERRGELTGPIARMLPPRMSQPLHNALQDLDRRLRWWLLGTLTSMAVTGLVTWLGLWAVGLEFALPLAMLAGFAEIVPTIGPASAFLIILLMALGQGTTQIIGVTVVYLAVQMLESYILLPLIMRQAVSVPPIVTLFTIVLWARLLGPLGLLLALPIDLAIWSFVDHLVLRRDEPSTG